MRAEATATLKRIAADGALTDAWCRSLVREGADVGAVFADAEAAAKMWCFDASVDRGEDVPLRGLPRHRRAARRGSVDR